MKILAPAITVIAATMVLVGCTSDGNLDTRILDRSWSDEWETRWLCEGLTLYSDRKKTTFESEELTAVFNSIWGEDFGKDMGKVVIHGTYEQNTHFHFQGLNPRWDWWDESDGDDSNPRYSISIDRGVSGWVARYYDFRFADEDGMAESRDIFFNCHQS